MRPDLTYLPYDLDLAELGLYLWEVSGKQTIYTPEFIYEHWDWIQQLMTLHRLKQFHYDTIDRAF